MQKIKSELSSEYKTLLEDHLLASTGKLLAFFRKLLAFTVCILAQEDDLLAKRKNIPLVVTSMFIKLFYQLITSSLLSIISSPVLLVL